MPAPQSSWIAIEFDGFIVKVAANVADRAEPVELVFYAAFYYDDESRKPIVCEDFGALSQENAERVVVLNAKTLKGSSVSAPGSDVAFSVDLLLQTLFAHIRTRCEKEFFGGRPVSTCVWVARKRDEFFDLAERAALTTGFTEVMFRNKAVCAATAFLREKTPREKYVVVCDVGREMVAVTALKRAYWGAQVVNGRRMTPRFYFGVGAPTEKLAEKFTEKALEKLRGEDAERWKRASSVFLAELDLRRDRFFRDENDPNASVRIGKKKIEIASETLKKAFEKFALRINEEIKRACANVKRDLNGAEFAFVLTGDGAAAPGLSSCVKRWNSSVYKFYGEGRSGAAACVELFDSLPIPPGRNAKTEEERDFVRYYRDAEGGDEEAALAVAKRFAKGVGTPTMLEEAFYWFAVAAQKKNAEAIYQLSKCLENGWGAPIDVQRSQKLCQQAAQLGYPSAQYKFALHCAAYQKGEENDRQVYHWLSLAAKSGHKDAQKKLASLDERREIVNRRKSLKAGGARAAQTSAERACGAFLSAGVFIVGGSILASQKNDPAAVWFAIGQYGVAAIGVLVGFAFAATWFVRKSKPRVR